MPTQTSIPEQQPKPQADLPKQTVAIPTGELQINNIEEEKRNTAEEENGKPGSKQTQAEIPTGELKIDGNNEQVEGNLPNKTNTEIPTEELKINGKEQTQTYIPTEELKINNTPEGKDPNSAENETKETPKPDPFVDAFDNGDAEKQFLSTLEGIYTQSSSEPEVIPSNTKEELDAAQKKLDNAKNEDIKSKVEAEVAREKHYNTLAEESKQGEQQRTHDNHNKRVKEVRQQQQKENQEMRQEEQQRALKLDDEKRPSQKQNGIFDMSPEKQLESTEYLKPGQKFLELIMQYFMRDPVRGKMAENPGREVNEAGIRQAHQERKDKNIKIAEKEAKEAKAKNDLVGGYIEDIKKFNHAATKETATYLARTSNDVRGYLASMADYITNKHNTGFWKRAFSKSKTVDEILNGMPEDERKNLLKEARAFAEVTFRTKNSKEIDLDDRLLKLKGLLAVVTRFERPGDAKGEIGDFARLYNNVDNLNTNTERAKNVPDRTQLDIARYLQETASLNNLISEARKMAPKPSPKGEDLDRENPDKKSHEEPNNTPNLEDTDQPKEIETDEQQGKTPPQQETQNPPIQPKEENIGQDPEGKVQPQTQENQHYHDQYGNPPKNPSKSEVQNATNPNLDKAQSSKEPQYNSPYQASHNGSGATGKKDENPNFSAILQSGNLDLKGAVPPNPGASRSPLPPAIGAQQQTAHSH